MQIMELIANLSKNLGACTLVSVVFFLFFSFENYLLLDSLLKMHRSKSAVKKLKKQYTFLQKAGLYLYETNCRHAVKFCKKIILFQRIGWFSLGLYLLGAILQAMGMLPDTFSAWSAVGLFILFYIPSLVLYFALKRPIIGRFKEYSFEKYHNTSNDTGLL